MYYIVPRRARATDDGHGHGSDTEDSHGHAEDSHGHTEENTVNTITRCNHACDMYILACSVLLARWGW